MTALRTLLVLACVLARVGAPLRAQVCIEFERPLATPGNSVDVLVADLDGDGDRDLAVLGSAGTLSIFRAVAPRSFAVPVTYPLASDATAIASADLDGDQDLDLVTSHSSTATVSVFRNNGNGTFAAVVGWSVGAPSTSIGCGDVDGDGDVDVAATLVPSGIAVIRNQGAGTFSPPTVIATSTGPYGLVCADADGDGDVDLACTLATASGGFQYFSNAGAGTFAAPQLGFTFADPMDMAPIDLEPDGDLDFVTCNARFQSSSGSFSLLQNAGAGSFQTGGTASVPSFHPTSLGVGDVTSDGVPEIVMGGTGLFVYERVGSAYQPTVTLSTGNPVVGVNVVDLDGDGHRDLVCVAPIGIVSIFYNAGGGVFPVTGGQAVGVKPISMAAGDFDDDGNVDVAVLNRDDNSMSVLLNPNGSFPFAPAVSYPMGTSPRRLVAAELNGDGVLDLAAVATGEDAVLIRMGTGNGTFGALVTHSLSGGQDPLDLTAADLDGDGDVDLAAACSAGGAIGVLRNTGAGTFFPVLLFPTESLSSLVNIKAGDMDADGDLDLVAGGASTNRVYVLLNSGSATFATAVSYPTPIGVGGMTLADLDVDSDLDVIIAMGPGVTKMANNGSGVLGPQVLISAPLEGIPYGGQSISCTDLDADGDLDVWAPDFWTSVVFQVENLGGGVFGTPTQLSVGQTPVAVIPMDFDGDGDPDLACVNQTSNTLSVLRNCHVAGVPICVGDGSGATCPCGNSSPVGSGAGCNNSLGLAGTFRASGAARMTQDSLVLRASGMPNGGSLYFQGSLGLNGGNGISFEDGLRCAGGSVVRLGVRTNVGGVSAYPGPSDAPVRVRGAVLSPGVRHYQVWYRDNQPFCTAAVSNTTNGLSITWQP